MNDKIKIGKCKYVGIFHFHLTAIPIIYISHEYVIKAMNLNFFSSFIN